MLGLGSSHKRRANARDNYDPSNPANVLPPTAESEEAVRQRASEQVARLEKTLSSRRFGFGTRRIEQHYIRMLDEARRAMGGEGASSVPQQRRGETTCCCWSGGAKLVGRRR
mmetsp:Transcript_12258/g.23808  ORF Transcript_12258/g.23808 Transcript_12258/m.23808 type:complete len:112 (+) Transcript_12258:48-383(+)